MQQQCDIAIIGAGPAGACAAKLLVTAGFSVVVIEKEQFPRFSIGESLLPQCMSYLQQAGLLEEVDAFGFQYKNGAQFLKNGQYSVFDFADKTSEGPSSTYQVKRAEFDKLLADQAQKSGAEIRYKHQLVGFNETAEAVNLDIEDLESNSTYSLTTRFVLDASGFGRVLPKMLDLEYPSDFPVRQAVFTHVTDHLPSHFDRQKILVTVHPEHADIWFWLIPFADGTSSIGVVGEQHYFSQLDSLSEQQLLQHYIAQTPDLAVLLKDAQYTTPVRTITGYSANVKSLYGQKFALLGNAGEFLDPVFSSGVTIALKSASLVSPLLVKHLNGQAVDWQKEYSDELRRGITTFWHFVSRWYNRDLQNIIFYDNPQPVVRKMICGILAGYAWDQQNPFVEDAQRRLNVLAEICAS